MMLKKMQSAWSLWLIAALFYGYEFTHRVAPSVLTSDLKLAFDLNTQQLGMLGALYFYAYALCQIPAGMMIDKYGPIKPLIFASGLLTIGSFIFTLTNNLEAIYFSRLLIGAGSAFAFIGTLKIATLWLSPRVFPIVVGLTNLIGTLGALLGGMPLAHLCAQNSWRATMLDISVIGLMLTFLLLFFFSKKHPNKTQTSQTLAHVLKSKKLWGLAVVAALLVAPIAALPEMWGVEYITSVYQVSIPQAAKFSHTIFIGTALGGPFIGFVASKTEKPFQWMLFATTMALILLSTFLYLPKLAAINLTLILFAFGFCTANMLLCFAMVNQGIAIGFINTIIMLVAGLSQHLIGGLLQVSPYPMALSVLPLGLLFALIIIFQLKKWQTQ